MTKDTFPILGIDHLEFYVGSAKATARMLTDVFGFTEVAYAGLETGRRDTVSHVLVQNDIRFIVTGALRPNSPVAMQVAHHGDSVRDIAFHVPNARKAYETAILNGAYGITPPFLASDRHGKVIRARIRTYGDTVHTLVERDGYHGPFLPGYEPVMSDAPDSGVGLQAIDHVVGNVELGKMNFWADYYAKVMGFTNLVTFDDKQISTEYSALMSKVMWNGSKIKFPINEPAEGKRKSQIDEYLEFHGGPGVQHIALVTDDIVKTVSELRVRGVGFLSIPKAYYDDLRTRFADIPGVDVGALEKLGVLADRDEDGYLLQIFTKPIVDRPTAFLEVIERHGSWGFGEGNFKALFVALEREQDKRGNL